MQLIGQYHRLKIARITPSGAFLALEEGDILLPGKFIPEDASVGTELEVFVYLDSEDRPVATVQKPYAVVGDFALLTVKDTNAKVGSFLDWGLDKDLLLPFGEQLAPVKKGEQVLVRVYLDASKRIAATARLDRFLKPADGTLAEGDAVELFIYAYTDLGAKVVVNNRYGGMLFRNELYTRPKAGEQLRGYVRKIHGGGKIDITLRKGGAQEAQTDRDLVLVALTNAADGFLPLNDKSSPEVISELLKLSKKSFKKAVGGLYREGLIVMADDGIKLK
ncbi:MAG: S1-like domain-containing RNA-binding protein [Trichlorobacter sp.]|uniref:CvfB family protein n=1 Tax=Trichlorobacter sp. TaxID=2911007 RepID=UPI002568C709|nr:S1-like domain-containing RNA-binding protein [Trichlorobacter sp.]MDK9719081.1 S1-like domain-containing RNA-binding protein [Trichlorobacter sp.]